MRHLIAALLFCFVGCHDNANRTKSDWCVQLVAPSGKVVQTWDIKSFNRPLRVAKWDGSTVLRDRGSNEWHDWEFEIVAPECWYLRITKK